MFLITMGATPGCLLSPSLHCSETGFRDGADGKVVGGEQHRAMRGVIDTLVDKFRYTRRS